ncbi:hypothetical protein Cni_G13612 [Canna indica]|uniref:Flavin-containing monooxygenase n=1 Tax=Canna indica TaxID=4628 RepID=A0AAQ3QDX0_9LILI|nr:hypothetical protein Cni_G13612 [Canna indica]
MAVLMAHSLACNGPIKEVVLLEGPKGELLFIHYVTVNRLQVDEAAASIDYRITTRPQESTTPANLSFGLDGVATKDIHVDPLFSLSLSLRIFLPNAAATAAKSLRHAPNLDGQENCTHRSSYDIPVSAHKNDDDPAAATRPYSGFGDIKVVLGIKRFYTSKVELVDGRLLYVDSIILATGYRNKQFPSWLQVCVCV